MSHPKYYSGKTIREWAEETGVRQQLIKTRIKEGWTIEDAVTVPYKGFRKKEKTLHMIATENNISHKTLKNRVKKGMTIEEALEFSSRKNYIGQRSGRLLVVDEIEPKRDKSGRQRRQLLCLCDCGNNTTVLVEQFSSGKKQSCGCLRKEVTSKRREKDLTGLKFNRLLVKNEAFRDKRGIHWNCLCDCGNECIVLGTNMLKGNTGSCGCYNKDQISKHERKDITNKKFFRLTAKECIGKNEYNNYLWRCVCDCGREVITTAARLLGGQIISCGCTKSKGECFIEDYLKSKNIVFIKGAYFNDLKLKTYLYFDFKINDKSGNICLIEYQGEQHYVNAGEFGKQQREITDAMKKEYCKSHNILLYEIRYNEDIEAKMNEIIAQVNPVLSSDISETV